MIESLIVTRDFWLEPKVVLGSKTLGTNVLEFQFVYVGKTFSLGLSLLKVWFDVKLESSNCRNYYSKFARLD